MTHSTQLSNVSVSATTGAGFVALERYLEGTISINKNLIENTAKSDEWEGVIGGRRSGTISLEVQAEHPAPMQDLLMSNFDSNAACFLRFQREVGTGIAEEECPIMVESYEISDSDQDTVKISYEIKINGALTRTAQA